jgi:DnaJ-class molecular chaperone
MTHLIVAALIALPLYVLFCLVIKPTKACRRCGGWGSRAARRPRAQRKQCRRCDGTGRRFRWPASIAYAVRGAMRRHAQLTERTAARAERAEQNRDTADREQPRS